MMATETQEQGGQSSTNSSRKAQESGMRLGQDNLSRETGSRELHVLTQEEDLEPVTLSATALV